MDLRLEMGVRDGMPLRTVMCFVGLRMAISVRDGLWRGEGVELANRQPLSEIYIKAKSVLLWLNLFVLWM